jgi:DNA-binding HxlR family transcriptional regulator
MKKQRLGAKETGKAPRSPCPITGTLDILGDKWTLLVVRDMFLGKQTYSEFRSSPEGIPTNILADRLKRLEQHGIIDKKPYQQAPVRYAYHLTAKGERLAPLVQEIIKWGLENIPGTQAALLEQDE